MAIYTVQFYDKSAFSYVDPDLTNPLADEIFTGKIGAQLTTGSSLNPQSFDVYDSDSYFDDHAGWDQKLVSSTTIDGTTYPAGYTANGAYRMVMSSPSGHNVTIYAFKIIDDWGAGEVVGFISDTPLQPNTTYTALYGSDYANVQYGNMAVCFARGTQIETLNGPTEIQDLSVGDLVLTVDHGAQPIRWIGSRHIGADELQAQPNLRPIRIRQNALGQNVPQTDLVVSPQHRVLLRSAIAARMFDTAEVLTAAKHLLDLEGVEIARDLPTVDYFHILFDQHEVVYANGAEAESLFTGAEALKSISPQARQEIFAIFPELRSAAHSTARLLAGGKRIRSLTLRHIKNNKPLVTPLPPAEQPRYSLTSF